MALPTYSTGTVAVTTGGAVTVTGGIWSGTNVVAGDMISVDGGATFLLSDVSLAAGQIAGWTGGAVSGKTYVVYQCSSLRFDDVTIAQDLQKQVAALNTEGFYIFVSSSETAPDASLGDDGQYAFQATTGKLWVKESGLWSFLGIYKGFAFKGAWSSATAYTVNDVVTLDGSSYICISAHTNQTPPNATYWAVLASKGEQGIQGDAATIAVGTVTGVAYGQPATVTNVGTSGGAVFDFEIPKGQDGTGTGDVVGPATSTDNAVTRFDATTGKLLQNSGVIVDDSDNITGANSIAAGNGGGGGSNALKAAGFYAGQSGGGYSRAGYNVKFTGTANVYDYDLSDNSAVIEYGKANGSFSGGLQVFTASTGTAGASISYVAGPYVSNGGTSWTTPSDARLKENVQPITVLDRIGGFRAVSFDWKQNGQHDVGVIAQEVQSIFPEVVNTDGDFLGVDYAKLAALALQCVKELLVIVQQQDARIRSLETARS